MKWYMTIGIIIMTILLTGCSGNANAKDVPAEITSVENEYLSDKCTDSADNKQDDSQETYSMDDKDEKIFILERPDTNLEFWITENVDIVDFSKYQEKYGMMGGTQYYGSGYVPSIDEEGNQLDPEARVLYTVTSYPDFSSQTRHITSIYITDPSINVYGLTLNSTKDAVKSVMESNGFTYQDNDISNVVLYVKDKVSFFFMEKSHINIRVKVENENQLVF
jgi:hypothetical protein